MENKILKLDGKTAIELYPTASKEFRALLDVNFGVDFFIPKKITDRIKTFEDVLAEALKWADKVGPKGYSRTKIQTAVYDIVLNHLREGRITADDRIRLISFVLNEGWEPDFNNHTQCKYYPFFKKTDSGWVVGSCFVGLCNGYLGSGFYYKSSELALYAGKQFLKEYIDYLPE